MIMGERILEVSGNKAQNASFSGLNINIAVEDVSRVDNGNLEITYSYTANYEKGLGVMKIRGVLIANEDDKISKSVIDSWKANKRLPDEYAALVLSAVNYSGSANGTLVARVLGLSAPLIPPRIQLPKSGAAPAAASAAPASPAKGKK
jgi:hypothetical protein